MPTFPHYQPDDLAHHFALPEEVYKLDGKIEPGRNLNRKTEMNWYSRTRTKLLSAGEAPVAICEKLLRESFDWGNWLIAKHEAGEV